MTYNWDNKTTFLDSIVKDFLYDNNLRFINDHPRDNEIRLDYINIKSQKKFKEFQNKYLFDYILIHRDFIKNKQKYLNHNEIIKYLDQDFKVYKNYYQNKKIVFSIYKKIELNENVSTLKRLIVQFIKYLKMEKLKLILYTTQNGKS